MKKTILTISSLLFGIGILLFGNGLQSTLLALRGIEEGFMEGTIGIIMSMYFTGFIAGTYLCPGIIQRVGHIRTFSTMAALCASTIILIGLWINPVVWAVMRFVLGICIVGIYMVTESWLNTQADNQNRGRIFAIYILVNLVFLAAGQFLLLAGDIRTLELFAISAAFYCTSLVPVALTKIREPTPVNRINSLKLRDVYQISSLGFMGSLISGFLSSLYWSLAPLFASLSGLSEFEIALFMSITIFGGIILQWPIGYWSDRTDRRTTIMFVSFGIVISSALALLPVPSYIWLAACMFIFGGMMFSIYPLSVAHTNDHPEATDRVAITTNLLLVFGLGASIAPIIGGYLMQSSGKYSLFALYILAGSILGCFAWYWKRHGADIKDEDKTTFKPLLRTSQVAAKIHND